MMDSHWHRTGRSTQLSQIRVLAIEVRNRQSSTGARLDRNDREGLSDFVAGRCNDRRRRGLASAGAAANTASSAIATLRRPVIPLSLLWTRP
jgi:hypothetical protein